MINYAGVHPTVVPCGADIKRPLEYYLTLSPQWVVVECVDWVSCFRSWSP